MFSIQSASTGPSKRIHFTSGVSSVKSNETLRTRSPLHALLGKIENGEPRTGAGLPHDGRYHPVVPLARRKIVLAVELGEAQRFRIDGEHVNDLVAGLLVLLHARHRVLQHLPRDRLGRVRFPDYHRRVPRVHRLEQLDNFRHYQGNRL